MPYCIIPGCPQEGRNKLGVRCRVWHDEHPTKTKTSAVWAPDADAYLCDEHASSGGTVRLSFEPDNSGEITVLTATRTGFTMRSVPIR